MCLIALALAQHARFPLVVAANRDEFFDRPAVPLDWWAVAAGGEPVLGGRDLQGSGTWLGLTAAGRLAMLTNIRSPVRQDPLAPSRGGLVPAWLASTEAAEAFWARHANAGHNGFNLIAADFARRQCFWAANTGSPIRHLPAGLYGLSNAALDVPWPKVVLLKERMRRALHDADSVDALASRLFDALADRSTAPDDALPDTGIGLDRERWLAPAFIGTPDGRYGTRCATLVISEHGSGEGDATTRTTHVIERSFDAGGAAVAHRHVVLAHWPPDAPQGAPRAA